MIRKKQHKCRLTDLELMEYIMNHSDFQNTVRVEENGFTASFRPGAMVNVQEYSRHTNRPFEIEGGEIFFPSQNRFGSPLQRLPLLRWIRSLKRSA